MNSAEFILQIKIKAGEKNDDSGGVENMIEKRLRKLGIFGVISLLSYTAMVLFSPLAYPGYDWLSMAVSDLCAKGAPSEDLAGRLNELFGPCGLVSIMAVCVSVAVCKSKVLTAGVYFFTAMEWICNVGY